MDNLIGKKLDGRYQLEELIGSGGMANVYKAVMRGRSCGRNAAATRILCGGLKTNPRRFRYWIIPIS